MSFIDSVIGFGKKAVGFLGGDSIGGTLARTALLGYALNRVVKSANKDNQEQQDQGTDHKISQPKSGKIFVFFKVPQVHLSSF